MNSRWMRMLGVVGLAAVVASLPACAADTEEDADAESTEEALTTNQVPGTVAVEIGSLHGASEIVDAKTVGAPKKVKALLTAMRKKKASESIPRCVVRDSTRIAFLDASGEKIATVNGICGPYASLTFEDGRAGFTVKYNKQAIASVKESPFAVGDALWGITKIVLRKPKEGPAAKLDVTGEAMKPILRGFDLDAVPNSRAAFPRCVPDFGVSFERANENVALSSFMCGSANPPASVNAKFTAIDLAATAPDAPPAAIGAIQIDPRPVINAFAASTD